MPTLLITGANRGIGLEFVRQYAAEGWDVIATCRNPQAATELCALNVEVHALDVAQFDQIAALGGRLAGRAIDVLINNAGIYGANQTFGAVDADAWLQVLRVNTLAPLKMAEAFADNVARSQRRVIASISSRMGSIDDNDGGGDYAYRSSKAALNMVNKSLSLDLRGRGIICIVLHPGWVKTAMGGPSAIVSPQQSVAGMRRLIDGATLTHSGRFFTYDGQEVPW